MDPNRIPDVRCNPVDTWIDSGSALRSGGCSVASPWPSGFDCLWVMLSDKSHDLMVSLLRSPATIPMTQPIGSKTTSQGVNFVKFNCNFALEIETEKWLRANKCYCGCKGRISLRSEASPPRYSLQLSRLERFFGRRIRFFLKAQQKKEACIILS